MRTKFSSHGLFGEGFLNGQGEKNKNENVYFYRPQTKFEKVMFLHVSVILSTGGAIPACIAGGIPACLAAGLQDMVSQHALQVSRPTPKGEV